MALRDQLYLIHGNNEAEVGTARYELVTSLLTPEERDAGLTEVRGAGNQPLQLDRAMSEILEELGTTSFLGDSRRVVVVHDLKDFYEAKRSRGKAPAKKAGTRANKQDRTGVFLGWLRDVLPTTPNIAIFVCLENDEKMRTIAAGAPLTAFIKEHGTVIEKKDKPLQFELEDLLLSGNTTAAVETLRDWIGRVGSDGSGRQRIYGTLATMVELLLQAQAAQEARSLGVPESRVAVDGFPSIGRMPGWKAKKVQAAARRYQPETLRRLVRDIHRLQLYMYPQGTEDYVPSWEERMEDVVVRLTMAV